MTKPTKWHVCPAKTQISMGICPVWSESSLSAWRKLGSLAFHWAHSKDSDQTGQMPRLICVFAGCNNHFVGFLMMRMNFFTFLVGGCGTESSPALLAALVDLLNSSLYCSLGWWWLNLFYEDLFRFDLNPYPQHINYVLLYNIVNFSLRLCQGFFRKCIGCNMICIGANLIWLWKCTNTVCIVTNTLHRETLTKL